MKNIIINFQLPVELTTIKACAGRVCALDETISDVLCSLTDRKCGLNMAFKTIGQPLHMGDNLLIFKKCIQQCTCVSNEYVKKDGQCIEQNSVPNRKRN